MLNSYDFQKFCQTPVAQTIHRCAMKSLPEIGLFPSVIIPGCSYDTPILKAEGDQPIFCKIGEGACSSKSDFAMKRNETYGFDVKVEAPVRAEECEGSELRGLLGMDRFAYEDEDKTRIIFERAVKQLYLGTGSEHGGFGGLPEAVCYKVDALAKEWNCAKDFTDEVDENCLYSIFLLHVADNATIEAQGLKWIWGNGGTITDGARRIEEIEDVEKSAKTGQRCTYEGYVKHKRGSIGFAHTCATDVIEIANVPGHKVDGFYLENVLSQALLLAPSNRPFNRILTHKLPQNAMWLSQQNANAGTRNCCIVAPTEDGGFSRKMPSFFDGTDTIPLIISDCMPTTPRQTVEPITQKEILDKTVNTPKNCAPVVEEEKKG